jgi:transposase
MKKPEPNHNPSRYPVVTDLDIETLTKAEKQRYLQVLRGIEIEIAPTEQQKRVLNHWFGINRHAWNHMLGVATSQEEDRYLQQELQLVRQKLPLANLFSVHRVTRYLYGQEVEIDGKNVREGICKWTKPKLPDHATIKERKAVSSSFTITLPTGESNSLPSRKKHKDREKEAKARLQEAKAVMDWLYERTDIQALASKAAQERIASYSEYKNPRAKVVLNPGPPPPASPNLTDKQNKKAQREWAKAKEAYDIWVKKQAEKAEKRAEEAEKQSEEAKKKLEKYKKEKEENPFSGPSDLHGHWTDYRESQVENGTLWLRTYDEVKADKSDDVYFMGAMTREVSRNLTNSFKRWWEGEGGHPLFQKKEHGKGSCRVDGTFVATPEVISLFGMDLRRKRKDRLPLGKYNQATQRADGFTPCYATLKRHGDRYYFIATLKWWIEKPIREPSVIGIDVNGRTKNRIVISQEDGTFLHFPTKEIADTTKYDRLTKRIKDRTRKRIDRKLKRQKGPVEMDAKGALVLNDKGKPIYQTVSKRYEATLRRKRALELHLTNRQKDLNHKVTRAVVDLGAHTVLNQKLRVRNMMKNRRMASQTANVGYAQIDWNLHYKQKEAGGELRLIGSFVATSVICTCGARIPSSTKEYITCPACQIRHQRDELASAITRRHLVISVPYGAKKPKKSEKKVEKPDAASVSVPLTELGSLAAE